MSLIKWSECLSFFEVLDAKIQGLRSLRSQYDEEMAFGYNSLYFFDIGENRTSEIIAYLLNPKSPHGQKRKFLDIFIRSLDLPLHLVEEDLIEVQVEDHTVDDRRIDITICFGKNKFLVGIENKIGTASDQPNQLHDYAVEAEWRTKNKDCWILFYLTPDGAPPSEISIPKAERIELERSGNLRRLSYREHGIRLFEEFESACKAPNVRAFLKEFAQYLRREHRGESYMEEQELIESYIKEHPRAILAHFDAVGQAIESLKQHYRNEFISELRKALLEQGVQLGWGITPEHCHTPFESIHNLEFDRKDFGFVLLFTNWPSAPRKRLLVGFWHENESDFDWETKQFDSVRRELRKHFDSFASVDINNQSLAWLVLVDDFMTNDYMAGVEYRAPMRQSVAPICRMIVEYIGLCTNLLKQAGWHPTVL